jgi:flagellar P-ring protein FlgI
MKTARRDESGMARETGERRRASSGAAHLVRSLLIVQFVLMCCLFSADPSDAARIKDIGSISGVRTNQLIGYGLVIGLKGTGDKVQTIFTTQSLSNMLEKMGIRVDPTVTKVKNIAAVMLTADLPPFAKVGNKIDVVVSSIGDATSIEGGVLVLTPLKGADGEVYGVAQGPIVVGGFLASGQGASVTKNHPTVGRIANGLMVEKELNYGDYKLETVTISLKTADFTNTRRVVERINSVFEGAAQARDGGTITVTTPEEMKANPIKFVSIIENLQIKPDGQAKIVVDEKNGTVVIGENVMIATVAIAHGNISVQIKEDAKVSQPMPFSGGQTVVTPNTKIKVDEEKAKFIVVEGGVTIRELVKALNAIGVTPRDMITILQTIKAAGALHAELEVI